jgi:ATP-binding cassette subfamily B protein
VNAAVRRALAPVAGRLAAAVGLQVLASAAQAGSLLCTALLASFVVRDGSWNPSLWGWAGAAVALLAAGILLAGSASFMSHLADNALLLTLRRQIVARLGRVRLGWFTANGRATVKKVVQDDTSAMHHLVAHALLDITTVVVMPVVSAAAVVFAAPALGGALVVLAAVSALLFRHAMAGSGARMGEYARAAGELNAAAVEAVEGVDVIRGFSRRHGRDSRLRRAADGFHDFFLGWVGETRLVTAAAFVLASPVTAILLVVVLGSWLVAADHLDFADVIPALVLGPFISAPVATIGTRIQALRRGIASAEAIDDLAHEVILEVAEHPLSPRGDRIEAFGATFSYEPGVPAVQDLSFSLEPGTLTAVVGASGAGKSTLAALIARFEDPQAGSIRLGGVDLRDIAPDELYRHVGFVFQDVALMRASVRDVILMGHGDVDDAEIVRATRAANVHDRITAAPLGYDAIVGRDIEFSGGEAQRIAIARALLADPRALVLDEATSFADPESEAHVQQALSRLTRGRTVLVIAHRLATVRHADQILVMDRGRIAQHGTHDDLVGREGPYRDLWQASETKAAR